MVREGVCEPVLVALGVTRLSLVPQSLELLVSWPSFSQGWYNLTETSLAHSAVTNQAEERREERL